MVKYEVISLKLDGITCIETYTVEIKEGHLIFNNGVRIIKAFAPGCWDSFTLVEYD